MKRNVLLIWPWSQQHQRTNELFPIGIGYIASNIDKDRFSVNILDCALDDIDPDSASFREKLLSLKPMAVGISWWSLNTPVVEKTIKAVRASLGDVIICVGGPHATACGDGIIRSGFVDYVFYGEAEIGFSQLLAAIDENDGMPDISVIEHINGLIYRDRNGIVRKTPQSFVEDLDKIGRIDYNLMRLEEYHKLGYYYGGKLIKGADPSAPIITTRGCPYQCDFCLGPKMNGRKIRRHSIDHIIESIKLLYSELGVRYITIADDNFTMDTKWAEAVCNAIVELKFTDLKIGTPNGIRMSKMNEKLARAMKSAGWKEVMIAPESGSPKTLRAMKKQLDLKIVPRVIEMFHRFDIKVTGFFIIGYPGETLQDIALTEKFIFENDFDFVGISIFQPLPGTSVYNRLIQEGQIPRGFIPGHYQEVTFKHRSIERETLRDEYNRIWNLYRQRKNLAIKNRNIATIREADVISEMM